MGEIGVFAIGIGVMFLILLAILWCLLPFAVFGTKDKIDTLIRETKETNAALAEISNLLKAPGAPHRREP